MDHWSEPRILTETDSLKNFCSPGNIVEHKGEYWICITSYPMPLPYAQRSYADDNARLYFMRTKDFINFSPPEQIRAKGKDYPFDDEGRMIDPFLLQHADGFTLFFKQNGVSFSTSRDLENWSFRGRIPGGENACVLEQDGRFLMIHSPENGIGFKESTDLIHWVDRGVHTLNQDAWDGATGRLTAGFAMEACGGTDYRYILFFHGSRKESIPETHGAASLACAFTDDFQTFYYLP